MRLQGSDGLATFALLCMACTSPDHDFDWTAAQISAELHLNERDYAPLISAIPEFGGYYLEKGKIIVNVADLSPQAAVDNGLEQYLPSWLHKPIFDRETGTYLEGIIEFRKVDYSFLELAIWRNRLRPAILATGGFVSLAIYEDENAIKIGVVDEAVRQKVYLILDDLAVPFDAVHVRIQDYPALTTHTTSSTFQPAVPAGVVVYNTDKSTLSTAGFGITNGFFVNSHATSAWFSVNVADPDVFEQPANGNRMGYEAEDPWSFACGAYDCRYSDAARIAHGPQSVVPIEFGEIARTYYGTTEIDHNDPRFHIVSESTQLVGMDVDKVGFNTGWTFGILEDDCADLSPEPGILLLCQSIADYDFGAGDSGGSVFVWNGTSDVSLLGLHWGGSGDGTKAFFSSVENLHWDFGPFATY